jgi:hypothetical protein
MAPDTIVGFDTRHALVGTPSEGLGFSYSTSRQAGYITALAPGVAWKDLVIQARSLHFKSSSGFGYLEVDGQTILNGGCTIDGTGWNRALGLIGSPDSFPFTLRIRRQNEDQLLFYLRTDPNILFLAGRAQKTEGGTSWEVASDRRLKQNLRAFEPALNEVLQLRPMRFRYCDDPKRGLTSAHEGSGLHRPGSARSHSRRRQ